MNIQNTNPSQNADSADFRSLLTADLDAIYIGNLNTVDADLDLPLCGQNGSVFTWTTGEERFITAEGKVHRPLYGMGNRKVVLTVTAELQGVQEIREYVANVIQQVKNTTISSVEDVHVFIPTPVISHENDSPDAESTGISPGNDAHTAESAGVSTEDLQSQLPPVVIVHCSDGRLTTAPVVWDTAPLNPFRSEPISSAAQHGAAAGPETERTGCCFSADAGSGAPELRLLCLGRVEGTDIPARAVLSPADITAAPSRKLQFLPIKSIRLLPGTVNYDYQQRMLEYLRTVDDDTMLYNFRTACGLDTKGAAPMTGWDEASCKLKGHTTGHYMSGLALAWAATGDPVFREKAAYMVRSLAECQESFARDGRFHEGFLSAYSEEQFDLLEVCTKYPEIWAPYYTLDKIMSGLNDIYRLADIPEALTIESRMGDWVWNRLSRLPKEQLTRMWSMYIAGEFGGMLGTMVKLYELTGKPEHLAAARLFDNEKLFYPMSQGRDTLEDMHANQHIPQILGAADLFRAESDPRDWKISRNFWEIVTGAHIYCVGGVGETEMFHAADSTASYLTDKAAESCASYNMLRLTGELFAYSLDSRMLDYYENTLTNHILTTCSHRADGGTIYFLPLGPGGRKEYDASDNTCCHGTGLESRFRYMEHICGTDADHVYLNLLVDCAIDTQDPANEVRLELTSDGEGTVKLQVESTGFCRKAAASDTETVCRNTCSDSDSAPDCRNTGSQESEVRPRKLRIHIPAWAEEKLTAEFAGSPVHILRTAASGDSSPAENALIPADTAASPILSLTLSDGWLTVDTREASYDLVLHFPMELRTLTDPKGAPGYVNIACGPWILAALSDRKEFLPAPRLKKDAGSLEFRDGAVRMIPLNRVDTEAYHVYFRR